jgi:hypothetical protein
MRNFVFVLVASLLFLLQTACEKQIPFEEVTGDRHLVVNSLLVADSLFEVQVFKSKFIYDRGYEPLYLNNATVSILEEGTVIETLPFVQNGYYRSTSQKSKVGHTYQVKVTDAQGHTALGKASVLEPVPVILFDSVGLAQNEWGNEQVVMSVTFQDDIDSEDYYRLAIKSMSKSYVWDEDYYQPIDSFEYISTVWTESSDPAYSATLEGYLYFSDAIFNGKEYSFELRMGDYSYNYESTYYYVYLEHISRDFYRYNVALDGHFDAEDMSFFMEAVLVYGNVEDGLGIIGSVSVSIDSLRNPNFGKTWDY